MNFQKPCLYMLAGKIASGKSTFARQLATNHATVLIREDQWLEKLYGDQMSTIEDYIKYSRRLRHLMGGHVIDLLENQVSVVLDFPANTRELRAWMRSLFEAAGANHELHYFDLPDEICKQRLRQRNAEGVHEFAVSDDQYEQMTRYLQPPSAGEGFTITIHS